jgi:integrase
MSRRGKGEGSIEKLPSGKFRAVLTTGRDPTTGKQLTASKTFETRREAVEWKDEYGEQARGEWAKKPLAAWFDNWLGIKRADVEPATVLWYESRVERYLKPLVGARLLGDLSPLHVREMLGRMKKEARTAGEQFRTLKTLRAALQEAVRLEQVNRNVATLVKLPKVEREEMRCLDRADAGKLLAAARGGPLEPFITLALDTGMRPGELFALHWPDVDLTAGTVNVRQSLEYLSGTLRLKRPKTKAGRRRIGIAPRSVEVLTAYRESMRGAGHDVKDGPVLIDGEGGLIRHPNFRDREFVPLMKRADVPMIRLYDLRHTSATLLLAADVNIKVVSQRLGHEDISITLRHYAHALPSMQERAVSAMQEILTNPTVIPRETDERGSKEQQADNVK